MERQHGQGGLDGIRTFRLGLPVQRTASPKTHRRALVLKGQLEKRRQRLGISQRSQAPDRHAAGLLVLCA